MSRFTLLQAPRMRPGCCGVCRSSKGPFVDTMVTTREGAFIVCAACIIEIHEVLGAEVRKGFTPGEITAYKATIKIMLDTQSRQLQGRIEREFSDARTATRELVGSLLPVPLAILVNEVDETDAEGEPGDIFGTDSTGVENVSIAGVEGPDDVSSDSDDGSMGDGEGDLGGHGTIAFNL